MIKPEELAALAKDNFYAFPILASGNKNPRHIHFIAVKIQDAIERPAIFDKFKILIFTLPPRSGKTQLISKHLPPWVEGKHSEKKIILTSYGSSLAINNSEEAKELFKEWGDLLWNIKPGKKFTSELWKNEKGGMVKAGGVRTATTGYGADIFIIDDYFKDERDAESVLIRDRTWEWWLSVANTRLHPGAAAIILCTRWHHDDLVGRILKQDEEFKNKGEETPFEIEYYNFPAICLKEEDELGRKKGESLWPSRFSIVKYKNIERAIGKYFWCALYEGNPSPREGALYKYDNFRYYERDYTTNQFYCYRLNAHEPLRIPYKDFIFKCYVDPALEEKKSNDPSCMHIWGYSKKHKVWILVDRYQAWINQAVVGNVILNFAFKNNAIQIGVENEKLGKVLVKQSYGSDQVFQKKIPFKEIPTKRQDKFTRAVPMATYVEQERVFFPKYAPWLQDVETNLIQFPKSDMDHDVDCMSMAAELETKKSVLEALSA